MGLTPKRKWAMKLKSHVRAARRLGKRASIRVSMYPSVSRHGIAGIADDQARCLPDGTTNVIRPMTRRVSENGSGASQTMIHTQHFRSARYNGLLGAGFLKPYCYGARLVWEPSICHRWKRKCR